MALNVGYNLDNCTEIVNEFETVENKKRRFFKSNKTVCLLKYQSNLSDYKKGPSTQNREKLTPSPFSVLADTP